MEEALRGEVLAKISDAVAGIWARRHGHGPDSAKTYAMDDFVLTVLQGGFTPQEETLLASGHVDLVRRVRGVFEAELMDDYRPLMRRLTGRDLVDYQSQMLARTGITIEFFVLGDPG